MLKTLRRKTIGDLKANWKQFLAMWLVLTLGTAFYGAMYPSGVGLADSVYRTYHQFNYMDYQVRLEGVSLKAAQAAGAIPGVQAYEPRLVVEAGVQLNPPRDSLTGLRLVSLPDHQPPQVNRIEIVEGRPLRADDEILLLKRFADAHAIRPDQDLPVWINGQKHTLRVAGFVFSPEYLVAGRSREYPFPTPSSFGVAWMGYTRLAGLAHRNGQINDIVVRLAHPMTANGIPDESPQDPSGRVRYVLEQAFNRQKGVEVFARIQTASGGVIDANVNGTFPILGSFSALFLGGGLLTTGILLGRLVQSQRQQIGALRALGVRRGELLRHYLGFGALLGLSGGLAGSALGYLFSFAMMYPFIDTLAGGYLPGFINRPQFPFILLGFGAVTAGAILAGAYPAWKESATPPGIALRPPMPTAPSRLSRLHLGLLSLPLRQALRNLLRVPGRSLGSTLGVMAGATLVFAALAILTTLNTSFDSYYASGQYDLRLVLGSLQPAHSLEQRVAGIAGVQTAQTAMFGPIAVQRADGSDFDTYAFVYPESNETHLDAPFYQLETLSGAPALTRSDGVWIGNNLKRALNLEVGDLITLEALDEERQAIVLGVVSQVLGSPVFIPRSLMTEWMPGHTFAANAALVRVRPGQKAAVQDELAKLPGVIEVQDYAAFVADLRAYLVYWQQTSLLFALFGAILTLAVILNTIGARLHEQYTELAILRSLGLSRGEIAASVLFETGLTAGAGLLAGAPVGRALGFYLTQFYNTDFYGLIPHMAPAAYAVGVGLLLLTALLAALPGLRAVQRLDLGQVSKSQSI